MDSRPREEVTLWLAHHSNFSRQSFAPSSTWQSWRIPSSYGISMRRTFVVLLKRLTKHPRRILAYFVNFRRLISSFRFSIFPFRFFFFDRLIHRSRFESNSPYDLQKHSCVSPRRGVISLPLFRIESINSTIRNRASLVGQEGSDVWWCKTSLLKQRAKL